MSSSKKESFARAGIATKGLIYTLVGTLTAYAALGNGQSIKDSGGVLKFIVQQNFGQILLITTTVGIIGYVFWRTYQSFKMPNQNKNSKTASTFKRIGYFLSGLSYALLAYTAIEILLNTNSGSSKKGWIASILEQEWGIYLIYLIAILLVGKSVYEIYRAYSGKFKKKIQNAELDSSSQSILIKIGKLGITARAVVIGIIAFLFYKAAHQSNENMAGGTKMAFSYLQEQGGQLVLGIIALGLGLYGIYLLACSRYRNIPI